MLFTIFLVCRGGECQLYLDVDCSSITYDTKPSAVVLEAVNKTLDSLGGKNVTVEVEEDETKPANSTISASPNVTLANSLLSSIDKDKASKEDIKEAFCRDVDSFSWEFGQPERYTRTSGSGQSVGSIIGTVVGAVGVLALCCVCCACCVCKGAVDKLFKSKKSSAGPDPGVTFSSVQGAGAGDPGYPQYPPQPSAEPPAIPPTQPGYNNYPPEYSADTAYPPQYPSQYPASNQPPYPPNNQTPYPPNYQSPYPPASQPPFNPGPHY